MKATIFKNILDTTNPFHREVSELLDRIKSGKSKDIVEKIRQSTDKEIRNNEKKKLPSICWSGEFSKRSNDSALKINKLIVLDFDNIEDVSSKKKELCLLPYCYACWVSPSGTGVKMLVKTATVDHLGHFNALSQDLVGVDKSGKDLARVCYESYDPEIYINDGATEYTKTFHQKKEEVKSVNQNDVYEKLKKWLLKQGQDFVDGNRNNFITRLAAACNRAGMQKEEARFLIYSDFIVKDSNFSESEFENTINGIYTRYSKDFGQFQFKEDSFVDSEGKELTKENFQDGLPPKDIIFCKDVAEDIRHDFVNGLEKASTTFFPEIDNHFRWQKGQLNVLNGFGNYGKSTFFTQLMLIRSIKVGEKWCVFSPEQSPAKFYYRDLIQQHTGRTFEKGYPNTIKGDELDRAIEFINDHFFLVEPYNDSPTPEYMLERFFETIIKNNVDGVVIDPFNQLANHWEKFSGKDTYLEKYLNTFKQFAKQNNIYFTIIAHPKTPGRDHKNESPDVFDLAGGAMWNNKADNILCYHRPNHHIDKSDPNCLFISQKIRFQQIVGIPGSVDMRYDRQKFRFYINNFNPIDGLSAPQVRSKSFEELLGERDDDDFFNKLAHE